eukprot:12433849-Alexandrium_andersonii.AAC.1
MMICAALATPPGAPVVCTCVLASLAAASSTMMHAESASRPACARKTIRALPQLTSASMSAWWLQ